MSMSDITTNINNKDLAIIKLENELNRTIQIHKFEENLWIEKADSLNSIISEQRKVISLLESVLKSNQQLMDSMQANFLAKDGEITSLAREIESEFDNTAKQIGFLKENINKLESMLAEKQHELEESLRFRASLEEDLRSLRVAYNAYEQEIRDLIKQRDELQLKNERVLSDYQLAEQHLNAYRATATKLQEQYDSAKLTIGQEKKNSTLLIKSLEQEIDNLRLTLKRKDSDYEHEKSLFAKNSASKLISEKAALYEELRVAKEELHLIQLEKTELISQFSNQKNSLSNLNAELHDERAARLQQQVEFNSLEEKFSKLQTNIAGLLAREKKYKTVIAELEQKVTREKERVYGMISYRTGFAILQATKSFRGFINLPGALVRIYRDAKIRREKKSLLADSRDMNKSASVTKALSPQLLLRETGDLLDTQQAPVKLKIAAVMDEFTYHSYAPEAEILQLNPDNWEAQLEEFKPDLLFIESAWQGLDGLWKTKISNAKEEIQGAIAWCKKNEIATMFWNKEDPVHFGTFIPLASMVDFVFTTDIDCIPKYKKKLGHSRVYLLPFAAQPKTHNPIEIYERKDAFNFAGSYYLRYPERQRDFASLIDTVERFRDVEIFDRNFDNPHPHYTFPEKYKRFILGKLPFSEIDKAYKGYRYGINMNTIKQSQTMFARRVFELLASNTVVVSNFSRGVRLLFGDLVVSSDSSAQLRSQLEAFCNDELSFKKFRLLGLRKVFSEHTYSHRLAYIVAKLSDKTYSVTRPKIFVVAKVNSVEDYNAARKCFNEQCYENKQLLILSSIGTLTRFEGENYHFFDNKNEFVSFLNEMEFAAFVAVFDPKDYYGEQYLSDLALAVKYTHVNIIGKGAHYSFHGGQILLEGDGQQYKPATTLCARASLVRRSALTNKLVNDIYDDPSNLVYANGDMVATDEFHYCKNGAAADLEKLLFWVGDLSVEDKGVSYSNQLISIAEGLQPMDELEFGSTAAQKELGLTAQQLFEFIPKPASSTIQFSLAKDKFKIVSKLPENKHAYVYTTRNFRRDELNLVLNSEFKLHCAGNLSISTVFEFQDENEKKIAHSINKAGDTHALAIPENCVYVRFGLKIQASGQISLEKLVCGSKGERPFAVIGKSNRLIVSKQYPDYHDLYKYGFLHSRVRAYKNKAAFSDMYRLTNDDVNCYREFEGIDVASGDHNLLKSTLSTGQFKTVMVHILDEKMWEALRPYLDAAKIIVWIHGSEIQHWKHRAFEFKNMTPNEIKRQKKLSDNRTKFWKDIFSLKHPNVHFVFVSQWLANTTQDDLGIQIPNQFYSVISNFIDPSIFTYSAKNPESRLQLLSIRPYAKLVYANDVTVAAILELSKRPFFEQLKFTLVGDGELFDNTVKPLREFTNVQLIKRFLTHREIADFHRKNGIFLVPTRMDTQGVSRDEAMSSGLVPITTNVAAIPEFVDDTNCLIVPPEDPIKIADAVEDLYRNPDKFLSLSANASSHVNNRSDFENTIGKEICLFLS
ncbi:glycosyltransferase [Advenella incenata]